MEITIHAFWIVFFVVVVLVAYFVKECFFKTKDTDITTNIIDKFPLVSWGFRQKSIKEQNIENNQEIHENNKKLDELEGRVEHLEQYVQEMNNKINSQLKAILEELQNRG